MSAAKCCTRLWTFEMCIICTTSHCKYWIQLSIHCIKNELCVATCGFLAFSEYTCYKKHTSNQESLSSVQSPCRAWNIWSFVLQTVNWFTVLLMTKREENYKRGNQKSTSNWVRFHHARKHLSHKVRWAEIVNWKLNFLMSVCSSGLPCTLTDDNIHHLFRTGLEMQFNEGTYPQWKWPDFERGK